MNTFIVAIAGHSGAGKSTLIEKLSSLVGEVNALRIDDYESSSYYPPSVEWVESGANPNEFQTPQFFSDIFALKNGKSIFHPKTNQEIAPARFLFIEEPFGRSREAIGALIDFLIYVDTPLEIALARKLLRTSNLISQGNSDITIEEHLLWYLRIGRIFYLAVERNARMNCDLVIDGTLSTNQMTDVIHKAITIKLQN